VLGSNQRRLSRRFYSTLAPPESRPADQRLSVSRRVFGLPPSAMRPWTPGSCALEIHGRGTDGEGGSGYADRSPGFWPLACHFRLPAHRPRRRRLRRRVFPAVGCCHAAACWTACLRVNEVTLRLRGWKRPRCWPCGLPSSLLPVLRRMSSRVTRQGDWSGPMSRRGRIKTRLGGEVVFVDGAAGVADQGLGHDRKCRFSPGNRDFIVRGICNAAGRGHDCLPVSPPGVRKGSPVTEGVNCLRLSLRRGRPRLG
jgi:hypothetical protein